MTIRGKWAWAMAVALMVSIGLNVFALGAFAAWKHMGPARYGAGIERGMDRETARQAREYFRAAFKEHREDIREAGKAIREARRRAGETMRAPTLNEAALAADLDALHEANGRAQRVFERVLIEAARAMPDELRRKVDWRMLGRRGHYGDGERRKPTRQ